MTVSSEEINENKTLTVTCEITNTGKRDGMEIVQLYIRDKESSVIRPIKELKGFEKVALKAGETKKVAFHLEKRSFAYYEPSISDWFVEYGEFEILIGASSQDIRLSKSVYVNSDVKLPMYFDFNSTVGDVMACDEGRKVFGDLINKFCNTMLCSNGDGLGESSQDMAVSMFKDTPLRGILGYDERPEFDRKMLDEMIDTVNKLMEG